MIRQNPPAKLDKATREIRGAGLRATSIRVVLLNHLHQHHGPFTMAQLHNSMKRHGKFDLATVYRTVLSFEQAALISRVDFQDGSARYEYGRHHHHHIVCRECGTVEALEGCLASSLEKHVAKKGYKKVSHSLEFFATCAKCA